MFEICDNSYSQDKTPMWWIKAVSVINALSINTTIAFKTEHKTREDAEKELRGLKVYLRENYSHVDTEANYSKIV